MKAWTTYLSLDRISVASPSPHQPEQEAGFLHTAKSPGIDGEKKKPFPFDFRSSFFRFLDHFHTTKN